MCWSFMLPSREVMLSFLSSDQHTGYQLNMENNQNVGAFFTPIANTKPYFKAAFEGFAGSGKTYTMAKVAIGLHQRIQSKKPVVIFDTEGSAAKNIRPLFEAAGIEALVRESRTLADLVTTMEHMDAGVSDILLVDSLSHVWKDVIESYKKTKNRTALQFQDWGIINPLWEREFSDRYVNGKYHALFTGRVGYEYEDEKNEETGRREIYKSGIKMKAGGEIAYEPDVLVVMERIEDILGKEKRVSRQATVIKDRSTLIDGKTFENPEFSHFAPAVDALLNKPSVRSKEIVREGDTAVMFESDDSKRQWQREKDIAIEKIEALLTRIAPASTGKDKALKLDLMEEAFSTASWTELGTLPLQDLRGGYRILMDIAVRDNLGGAHYVDRGGKPYIVFSDESPAAVPTEPIKSGIALSPREEKVVKAAVKSSKKGK